MTQTTEDQSIEEQIDVTEGRRVTPTSVILPEDMYEWLRKKAFAERITRSSIIRRAIAELREREGETEIDL